MRSGQIGRYGLLLALVAAAAVAGPQDGTPGQWSGAVDSNWANGLNWGDSLVPTASTHVLIPTGRPRYPLTNSATSYDCARLEIQTGASLTIATDKYLDCDSALVIAGTLTINGHCEIYGDTCLISGTLVNAGTFYCDREHGVNSGVITNTGYMYLCNMSSSGTITNYDTLVTEEFTNDVGGSLANAAGGYAEPMITYNYGHWTNSGFLENHDPFLNYGAFTNNDSCVCYEFLNDTGAVVINSPTGRMALELDNYGPFTNQGEVVSGSYVTNYARVTNTGQMDCDEYSGEEGSAFTNDTDAVATLGWIDVHHSRFDNFGELSAYDCMADGYFLNDGDFTVYEDMDVAGTFVTNGNLAVAGFFESNEVFVNNGLMSVGRYFDNTGHFSSGPSSELRLGGGATDGIYLGTLGPGTCTIDRLIIEADSSYPVECDGSFEVRELLQVTGGNVVVETDGFTVGTASASGSVLVDSGASIAFISRDERLVALAATNGRFPYHFEMRNGTAIGARLARFLDMDAAGISVPAGATVDSANSFCDCTFLHGALSGPMLKIENGQDLVLTNVSFVGTAGYNIEKTGATGSISVTGGDGGRWGEDYDSDPNNLISWTDGAKPAWQEMTSMPTGSRPVKDGGWLVWDEGRQRIFAARGNKTGDFFSYAPDGDSWSVMLAQPGHGGKMPGKGAAGVMAWKPWEIEQLFATVGNSTSGFYRYDPGQNLWEARAEVPLGLSNKTVKGGTDMAFVPSAWWRDTGYIYLLKGYKNEFYRYNPITDSWFTLPEPPPGTKPKWDKGSFLVYDGNRTIYAHKAKYNEVFAFDVENATWSPTALPGIPLVGRAGKSKKAKDGSSGAWYAGLIFALKGGNTQELWAGDPAGSAWFELDTMPSFGRSLKKKRVKNGADIVTVGSMLYALKGNGTNELWRYSPVMVLATSARLGREGVTQSGQAQLEPGLEITPSPVTGGVATVRLNLPRPGPACVQVRDAVGRAVLQQTVPATRGGQVSLDLGSLNAGIYIVQISAPGIDLTRKIVLQR